MGEKEKKKKKHKKIRIQTSERHLDKLANAVPTASDVRRNYHLAILKQRAKQNIAGRKRKRAQMEMQKIV